MVKCIDLLARVGHKRQMQRRRFVICLEKAKRNVARAHLNTIIRRAFIDEFYAKRLKRMFVQCKLQELRRFTRHVTDFEYHSYLEAV